MLFLKFKGEYAFSDIRPKVFNIGAKITQVVVI